MAKIVLDQTEEAVFDAVPGFEGSTATMIAIDAGVDRTTAVEILGTLESFELVQSFEEDGVTKYCTTGNEP